MKRLIDITVAFFLLVLLIPVLAMLYLAVALALGRPVFFAQVRPGLHGLPFTMFKFRTMLDVRDAEGNMLEDVQRLTRFGRFLRSSSLDELPELWNVLIGDMSLVGPRPLLQEYLPLYSVEQRRRHEVRPGITGWAQVNGRNALDWETRFRLDVWYVDHHSIFLDLKILFLTVRKVIAREGISEVGQATMRKFTGNRQ